MLAMMFFNKIASIFTLYKKNQIKSKSMDEFKTKGHKNLSETKNIWNGKRTIFSKIENILNQMCQNSSGKFVAYNNSQSDEKRLQIDSDT
jgi:hypothetical protein